MRGSGIWVINSSIKKSESEQMRILCFFHGNYIGMANQSSMCYVSMRTVVDLRRRPKGAMAPPEGGKSKNKAQKFLS